MERRPSVRRPFSSIETCIILHSPSTKKFATRKRKVYERWKEISFFAVVIKEPFFGVSQWSWSAQTGRNYRAGEDLRHISTTGAENAAEREREKRRIFPFFRCRGSFCIARWILFLLAEKIRSLIICFLFPFFGRMQSSYEPFQTLRDGKINSPLGV